MPPPAGPSVCEQLWQQIHAQLLTVQYVNGYMVSLAAVLRGDHDPLSMPGFPVAVILPVSDLPESGAWETNRHTLSFAVRLWVQAGTTQHALLEETRTAVQYAMMLDPLWGGLADTTDEGASIYQSVATDYKEQCVDINYTVQYRAMITDPTESMALEDVAC